MFLCDNFYIIHRDIKIENIYITEDNHVTLLDFSVSKRIMTTFADQKKYWYFRSKT